MTDVLQKSDAELIADIKAKYEYYLGWAKKYKAMLDAYNTESGPDVTYFEPKIVYSIPKTDTEPGVANTIVEICTSILDKESRFMSLHELFSIYIKSGGTVTNRDSFGSRMAQLKKKGHFDNYAAKHIKLGNRYRWGLPEWFDGDVPKQEYVKDTAVKGNTIFQ